MKEQLSNRVRKSFEEKKEQATIMRNVFAITAVLYIGFIIWIVCIHRYEILWWAINVWLLLVVLTVKNHSERIDAELVLTYLKYLESREDLLNTIGTIDVIFRDGQPAKLCKRILAELQWGDGAKYYDVLHWHPYSGFKSPEGWYDQGGENIPDSVIKRYAEF